MKIIENRFILILARVIDHRIGKTDKDKPDVPNLSVEDALLTLAIRAFIVLINFITCGFVIANIIHHW